MRHSRNGRIDAWQTPSELKAAGTDVREGESSIDEATALSAEFRVRVSEEDVDGRAKMSRP